MYNKLNNIFHASGQLILSSKKNQIDFGIYSVSKVTNQSITKYLDEVYKSDNPLINLYMKNKNNGEECFEIGELTIQKDSYGIYGYHVDQFPLVEQLFQWGDDEVYVNIEQLTEAEYGRQKFKLLHA